MGFVRLILVGVFTGIYVRKLSYNFENVSENILILKRVVILHNLNFLLLMMLP